jgi:hypothetical protein
LILAGPDEAELDRIVNDMQKIGLKLTVDGDVSDFLGVKIKHESDGTIHLTQPQIIDNILCDLHLTADNVKTRQTPAAVTTILRSYTNSDAHILTKSVSLTTLTKLRFRIMGW